MKFLSIISCLILVLFLNPVHCNPSKHRVSAGVIMNKTHFGHWENGIHTAYSHHSAWSHRIQLQMQWYSNILGSGMFSDNIFSKHAVILNPTVNFRPDRIVNPYTGFYTGFMKTFFDSSDPVENQFNDMYKQKTFLLGLNTGINWKLPAKAGRLSTGIQFHLLFPTGVSYPLVSSVIWEYPLSGVFK